MATSQHHQAEEALEPATSGHARLELTNELRSTQRLLLEVRETLQLERLQRLDEQQEHKARIAESRARETAGKKAYQATELSRLARLGVNSRTVSARSRFSPEAFYGAQHLKDIRVLEQVAMRHGSLRARQAIALGATDLMLSLEELLFVLRAYGAGLMDDSAHTFKTDWNIRSLLSLARILLDQGFSPRDRDDAFSIYKFVINAFGAEALDERAKFLAVETAFEINDFAAGEELISLFNLQNLDPVQVALLAANEEMQRGLSDEWLTNLNRIYEKQGISPIEVDPASPGTDLLDRLTASAPAVVDGPLISVIMPTFNGSARIATAVNSVLTQTWQNLELLVVDDHSDEEHWDRLQRYSDIDSRVKLLRLDSNQGAYRARNLGFENSVGEFVTVHDDDDWSHPQKLEKQVGSLLENPQQIANMSYQTRIDQEYMFLRINENPRFNQRNYSSLMMRRTDIIRAGGWDDLNRAADAEFHDRISKVFGIPVASVESAPLSFMRARSGSLTSNEIRRGALDFARQTFGHLYKAWHSSLTKVVSWTPEISRELDPKQRQYLVPENMKPGRRDISGSTYDVIYVTDYRFPGGNSTLAAAEIAAMRKLGLKVAVAQLDSPVLRAAHAFNSDVHAVLQQLNVPIVTLTDRVMTDLVILRNPSILQFADRIRSRIEATTVAVVANTSPVASNGNTFTYDLAECVESAHEMFSIEPVVYPESPQIRGMLRALSPSVTLADADWTGFLEPSDYACTRSPDFTRRPVVGRHSRDHASKWPDTAPEIQECYVRPELFDTRILGGADSVEHLLALSRQPSVEVLAFGAEHPAEYLATVDFWVYQHRSDLTESFGMSIIEALASGAVVVLPPYMETLFGPAAIYASPSEVPGIIAAVWANPERYIEQGGAGVAYVNRHFSTDAFVRRLIPLLTRSLERR